MLRQKTWIGFMFVLGVLLLLSSCDTAKRDWEKANKRNTVEAYHEFIRKHPKSEHISEADEKVEALIWERARKVNEIEAYEKYLSQYPEGKYVGEAKQKIEDTEWRTAKSIDSPEGYQRYVLKYPGGQFASQAKDRMGSVAYQKTLEKLDEQFTEKLDKARTILEIESLIKEYVTHKFADKAIEKIEHMLFKQVKSTEANGRFIIREVTPEPNRPKSSLTFQGIAGGTLCTTEFPHDQLVFFGLPFAVPKPFGDGSVHRFAGKIELGRGNYTFIIGEGDKLNRLTFALIKDVGYVYLRGKGRVLLKNGKEIKLGY